MPSPESRKRKAEVQAAPDAAAPAKAEPEAAGDVFAGLIPTVDLSQPPERVVEKIRAAAEAEGPGFFYLENHGVPLSVLDSCIRAAHRFFGGGALAREQKIERFNRRHRLADGRLAVGGKGYIPSGLEGAYAKDGVDVRPATEGASGKRNTRESFTFRYPNALEQGREGGEIGESGSLRIEEQPYCRCDPGGAGGSSSYKAWRRAWEREHNGDSEDNDREKSNGPSEEEMELFHAGSRFFFVEPQPWPEEFRPAVQEYFDAMRRLAKRMYGSFETLLGGQKLEADLPMATFNLAHYAPSEGGGDGNLFGISDHTDWELFTLFYPAFLEPTEAEIREGVSFTGLEVWFRGGWHKVPHKQGTIIVNQGEMLARLSHGRFPAPVHRVAHRSARERYSLVSFWGLDFGAGLPCPHGGRKMPAGEHYLLRNQFLEAAK